MYITAGTIHGKPTVSTFIVNMLHALKLLTPRTSRTSQLCQHNFEHNRSMKALRIMPA